MDARRRAVMAAGISGMGLGLVAGPLPARGLAGGPAAVVSLDDFMALSARLVSRPVAALDRSMGARLLGVLHQRGQSAALKRLLASPAAGHVLAVAIRTAWYSGQWVQGDERVQLGFADALVWTTAPFLHVPGICGGATGYWAEPPRLP